MFTAVFRVVLFTLLSVLPTQVFAASPPVATTSPANGITPTSAVLNGIGTPNGVSTIGYFRISSTDPGMCNDMFGTRVPTASGTDLGGGSSPVPYSITTTGLTAGTTYYFCAIVSNASGTAFGSVLSFTIPAQPIVVTNAATNITASSATINGAATPLAASTSGWFRYSSTKPAACDDSFGSRVPYTGGTSLGAGIAAVSYAQSISSLLPSTTYYFCAIATNSYGTSFGALQQFTTPATAPSVSTSGATSLTRTSGVLNGYVNPGGASTRAWFRYATASPGTCNDTFGTRAPSTSGTDVGAGASGVTYTQNVSGLSPGVTYYYCAIAKNSEGTSWGAVQTFITPTLPTATTTAATYITNSSAQLNGSGNPSRANATGWFRYALTDPGTCDDKFGSRAPVTGNVNLGSDIYDQAYSQSISGLSSGTIYYYCAIVSSSEGTAFGKVLTFTTSSGALATTNPATSVTSSSATLNGAGNPKSASAQGWFRYAATDPGSCSDGFGSRAPYSGYVNLGAGNTDVAFAQSISGLSPATTYYYCTIASNSYGTGYGTVQSFTTPAMAPSVSTSGATNLTRTTAVLTGYGVPGGDATTGWFRYSTASPGACNDTFGTRAPTMGGSNLGSGSSGVNFQQAISGLTAGTTYYYCAFASNSIGTVWGSVASFITPSAPTAATTPATYITNSTAQLNGTGNPNRANTVGWFRYSLTNPGTCDDKFGSRIPAMGGSALGSDIYDQAFSQSISGLSAGTTYYYCAIVSSAEGTAFGAVQQFTTASAATATTSAASSITSTSATISGAGNPNSAAAQGWFRYAATDPGSCNDTFGARAPYSGYVNLGAGSVSLPFSQSLSGLTPGTKYYFCTIASNSYGTGYGSVQTFTTPAMAPTVSTSGATNLTRTTAVLTGYGVPGGDATTGWFRYATASPGTCNDTFGTRAPTMGGSNLGAGTGGVNFQQAISGLAPATTYYYCALASNSMGSVWGSVSSFITPAAPTATTTAATSITTNSAQLNGSGNPNRANATGWFRYAATNPGTCDDKFGSRAPTSGGSPLGSDVYDQAYVQAINGLSSGTTYYYCAIVSSSEGTAFGSVQQFTTSGTPSATTNAATSISATGATLNGAGNPNGAAAQGWFRYATSDPGTCNDGFGSRAPYSGYVNLGAGTSSVSFGQAIGSLSPGTKYYYCAIASNSYGTGFGSVMSFTTPAQAPTVSTSGATTLTRTTAVLTGYGYPGGDATTGWFRYATASPGTCNDTFGTRAPTMGASALGSGTSGVTFQQPISGLAPATTYYYCAIASNSVGTVFGSVASFITPAAPTAATTPASYITNSSAQLNGSGNPNRANTTGWFRYALTNPGTCDDKFGSRAPLSGGSSLGSDVYDQPFAQSISGLSAGTTYYYCAIVSSTEGTAFGAVQQFTTSAPPTATTNAASSISSTSAVINGASNPNGAAAQGWFRYSNIDPGSCNDAFGQRAPYSGYTNLGAGNSSVTFAQAISSLTPGATYYFCAIATNTYGTTYGAVLSFTTPAMAPTVTTSGATSLTRTTGILTGYANPGGDATTGWFRYSSASPGTCNDTFGTRAPTMGASALGSGTSGVSYQQAISGLTAGTTYYYCAIASNSVGTAWGSVQTFITPTAPTALTTPATALTNNSAQLNGAGNPNRANATGWFRYALTNPGTCDDKFGSRAPVTGGFSLGSDIVDVPYSASVTGLSSGTTYYYCAIVNSSEGTAFGTVQQFTTSGAATATTNAATSVASTTATLNGAGNANGASASGWFRYSATNPGTCNDTFGTRAPTSSGTSLGSGFTNVTYGQAITGLAPGVTYYFCAITTNTYGTGLGAVLSFTTPANAPSVSTDYTSGIAITLNGSANPNGAATSGWFRIATSSPGTCNDTFGTRLPTTGGASLGAGSSYVSYANAAPGLTPGTTYYYCAIASNAVGTSFGVIRSFVAPMAPSVSTLAATPVTATSATLNGSGNPNGNSTIAWFRYSTSNPGACNDVFGSRQPATGGSSLGAGTTATPFAEAIAGLSPATTYYFCAIASSVYGTSLGSVLSFTTPPGSPTSKPAPGGGGTVPVSKLAKVTTDAAKTVTATSAELHASATPNGSAATGWFRYDTTDPGTCDDKFGTRAPDKEGEALGSGSSVVAYTQTLTTLAPATTYYYCAVVENSAGVAFGKVQQLITQASQPTVTTAPPTDVAVDSAVLHASSVANGETATVWFRYSAIQPESCNDTFGIRLPEGGGHEIGAGNSAIPSSQSVGDLKRSTTYYYCAIAENKLGQSYGEIVSFTTGSDAPSVTTDPTVTVEGTVATVSATVKSGARDTTVWFRYGESNPGVCDDTFGVRIAAPGSPTQDARPAGLPTLDVTGRLQDGEASLSGVRGLVRTLPLSGLKPSTTYFYCAAARSEGGARYGQVRSFTTGPAAAPATGTVDTVEPLHTGGCSYTAPASARDRQSGTPWSLLCLIPLAALALSRRRRHAA